MNRSLRVFLLGGACLAAGSLLSLAAQAQTVDNIQGGGSTLAAKIYTSAAGVFSGVTPTFNLNYGAVGSGSGTNAFVNNNLALDFPGGLPPGSSNVDYGASDSFISSTNIATAQTSLSVPLIQIPMFATAVTVAYNLPNFTTDGSLKLTTADLCQIFSGHVTNFNDPLLSANNPAVTLPNQAITVVYRGDGSGTSNLFTTHLANVCTPTRPGGSPTQGQFYNANFAQGGAYPQITANAVVPSVPVTGTNTFSTVFTGTGGLGVPPAPAAFTPATGSGGVQTAIASTAGAIGYLSPDYTDYAPINAGASGFPPVASVNGSLPSVANTAAAIGSATIPSTAAQVANQQNFAPLVVNPSGGYSIVGYTYWFVSQCYLSATQGGDIKAFLSNYFGTASYGQLVSLNGFSPLPSTNSLSVPIRNYFLKNTAIGGTPPNLDVQDATVCTSGKGR